MKLTSVFSAGLFLTIATNSCLGSTIQGYDATARTYTISTTVTSQLNVPCCEERGSFQGTFTIQFFGLNGIYDPTKYPLFLTIPVIQTKTSSYPILAGGTVCLDTNCFDGQFTPPNYGNGTQTLHPQFILDNLNTTPFSWTFSLTTDMNAQSQISSAFPPGYNTSATGTEIVDFADLTLKDPFGNSLLSQGVTFQVTQVTPEPSSWALAGVGLVLLAFCARRVVSP